MQVQEESSEEEERTQSTQRNRRRAPASEDDEEDEEDEEEAGDDEMDVDARSEGQDQTVKKMVRYALACEYQRMPIRRAGISEKGRTFRVFHQY